MDKLDMPAELDLLTAQAYAVSQGNPGALNVFCQLIKDDGGRVCSLAAAALTVGGTPLPRGSELWVLYKDVCNCDLNETARRLVEMHTAWLKTNPEGVALAVREALLAAFR